MRFILFPFTCLYGLITDLRNLLFDKGIFKATSFSKTLINVGNLTVGGTGKTPHVEYLIRLLAPRFAVATLSRGYGRKTKGYLLANSQATANTIGDEPFQFYQKFQDVINVSVGEKRVNAVQQLLQDKPTTQVIILDDAFQHRAIQASLNILLVDYNRPIYHDFTFPAGRLRERRHGASRANIAIVSKTPDILPMAEQQTIIQSLKPYLNAHTPIFFTGIRYGSPQALLKLSQKACAKTVLLLSGIANPKPFEEYVQQHFNITKHLIYKDHYTFEEQDIQTIITAYNRIENPEKSILMTEKDMVKFETFLNHPLLKDVSLFYMPIEIYFLNQTEDTFNGLILEHIALINA